MKNERELLRRVEGEGKTSKARELLTRGSLLSIGGFGIKIDKVNILESSKHTRERQGNAPACQLSVASAQAASTAGRCVRLPPPGGTTAREWTSQALPSGTCVHQAQSTGTKQF
jgi:hypothetical protein